jgi:ligand-binding sensor domain-containing protein
MGDRILSLQESSDGWLNVFTENGWLSVSPTGEEARTNLLATAEEGTWQAARFEEQAQRLWIGSPQGLFRLDHGKRSSPDQRLPKGVVDLVWQDADGHVWVNIKEKGLFRRKGDVWENIPLGDEWTRQSTVCIQPDFEGNLWLGHDFGLICLQPRYARTYTVSDGLLSDRVWTVCESADGDIWAGTERGMNRLRRGEVLRLNSSEPEVLQRVRCVLPRTQGGIWIGTRYMRTGTTYCGLEPALG